MANSPFHERLRQSRIFQAVGVYLGMSWATIGAVDLVQQRLGLPDWVFTMTVILLLAGLVIVLATAWVQSLPATTELEEAGQLPTDWELAPADALAALRSGRLPHLTWARAFVGGVVAFSLLFGLSGLYVAITGRPVAFGPEEVGANEAAVGIAVLPFAVTGDGLELWREGMVDLLTAGMDGVAGFRTIDARTVLARWEAAAGGRSRVALAEALDIAGRTGARYGVWGSAVALGSEVRLTADLYDLSDGTRLARGSAEGPADSVLVVADQLGLALMRGFLQESGSEAVAPQRIAALTTGSLPALRAFLEGEAFYRRGDLRRAIASYEEAVALDGGFSLALYRLYQAFGWTVTADDEAGAAMADRLRENLEGLPARDRALFEADMAANEFKIWDARAAEALVEKYPDDPEAWHILGETHMHAVGPAQGGLAWAREAFERAVRLSPGFLPYYYHPIELAIGLADTTRARELLTAFSSLAPPSDERLQAYEFALWAYGTEPDAAVAADSLAALEEAGTPWLLWFDDVLPLPPVVNRAWHLTVSDDEQDDADLLDWAFRLSLATGRQSLAFDHMRALQALDVTPGVPLAFIANELVGGVPASELDEVLGPDACGVGHAEARCTTALALHALDRGRSRETRRWAEVDREQARALEEAGDSLHAEEHVAHAMLLEGVLAWTEGDRTRALATLDSATRKGQAPHGVWRTATYLVEDGRLPEAVQALNTLDDKEVWAPFAHLRIAEILVDMGERTSARGYFESALSAWVESDPGFARKARAEEGLRRLAGG